MKRTTRLLCLVLGLLMLLGVFAACGGDETETTGQKKPTPTTQQQTGTGGGDTPTTETPTTGGEVEGGDENNGEDPRAEFWVYDDDGFVVDGLDYDAIDFSNEDGNAKFRLLLCQAWEQWTFPRELGSASDPMRSAAYLRNIELEDLLGIQFEINSVNGHSAHRAEWMAAATTAVGEGCEMFCGYSRWMAMHAQEEWLLNLYKYDYPNVLMPWYPLQLNQYSQYNCLFFVTGTSTTRTTAEGNTCFADLALLNDMELPSPLQTVIKGEWTIDKLYEYTSAFHNLAVETAGSDDPKYGIAVENPYAFYYGTGNRYTRLNTKTGKQELACVTEADLQRASECVEEVMKVLDTAEALNASGLPGYQMMNEKRAAFVVCGMLYVTMVSTENNYAPLPIPKRNTDQETYLTQTTWAFEVFGVPKTTSNAEMSTVTLEAVYSSDYRLMAPLFFEKNLKGRYTNSSDGAAIYDIIRNSRVIDFGHISQMCEVGPENAWNACFQANPQNVFVVQMQNSVNKDNRLNKELKNLLAVYKKYGA